LGKMGCRVVSPPENNGQTISHTQAQDRVKLPHSTRLTLNTRPNSEASQGMRSDSQRFRKGPSAYRVRR
jgi:hypothetical protein